MIIYSIFVVEFPKILHESQEIVTLIKQASPIGKERNKMSFFVKNGPSFAIKNSTFLLFISLRSGQLGSKRDQARDSIKNFEYIKRLKKGLMEL